VYKLVELGVDNRLLPELAAMEVYMYNSRLPTVDRILRDMLGPNAASRFTPAINIARPK